MPELSIIVPIYKVEKYLPKCIESILNQSFIDWFFIALQKLEKNDITII